MKCKLWGAALLLALTVGLNSNAWAANKQVVDIKSVKVPAGVTLYQGDQVSLLTNKQDINTFLMDLGVLSTDVYQLRYKENNEFRYAVVADIRLGEAGLEKMGIQASMPIISLKKKKEELPTYTKEVAEFINANGANVEHPYVVVTPLTEQKNGTYEGVIRMDTIEGTKIYSDTLHIVVYENLYFGTSIRVIGLGSADDTALWPKVSSFAKVYK
ncbi:hypothetical protein [uncultured Veillonella sp.]|uniref:hypothetical protein n=1 Tax=uncultured Veillonella sp. TaxID=159268 RepID=UPI00260051FA|nr:hypothetical protein [uncultured Veillonella sp.]MDY3973432.1 hypothetical protein [Veillonella caviae]